MDEPAISASGTMIVIMTKDPATGFLTEELDTYQVGELAGLLQNTYASLSDNPRIHLLLTTERDMDDWEYEAVLDYYDEGALLPLVDSFQELMDFYNPTWEVTFAYTGQHEETEEKIRQILQAHKLELASVYEAIRDVQADYE